jgi:hypothetical protein
MEEPLTVVNSAAGFVFLPAIERRTPKGQRKENSVLTSLALFMWSGYGNRRIS